MDRRDDHRLLDSQDVEAGVRVVEVLTGKKTGKRSPGGLPSFDSRDAG
jgi:hypothetical protein